jgi:hypothetical protein
MVMGVDSMLVEVQALAGWLAAAAAVGARRRAVPAGPGVLSVLACGRAEVVTGRERRATLAMVLACLPAGWCVTGRDACGRERFTGPACAAPARRAQGAVR